MSQSVVWVEMRCNWPLPAKAYLTFPTWVGGAFRRVRFALACRTEPLFAMIILRHELYKRLQEHFHGALFWVWRFTRNTHRTEKQGLWPLPCYPWINGCGGFRSLPASAMRETGAPAAKRENGRWSCTLGSSGAPTRRDDAAPGGPDSRLHSAVGGRGSNNGSVECNQGDVRESDTTRQRFGTQRDVVCCRGVTH